jgi:hypothetical protein
MIAYKALDEEGSAEALNLLGVIAIGDDANPNRSPRKLALSVRGRTDRVTRTGERDEECISLCVDLGAPVVGESPSKDDPVSV